MALTLKLEIVTPEGVTFSDPVEMVTLPGSEGEMGIFPQHVPLMAEIIPGEITVRQDGRETFLAVGGGFVEITGDRVSILTDMAVKADSIDEAQAEAARKQAESRLREKVSAEEEVMLRATMANALAQVRVKSRRHGHH